MDEQTIAQPPDVTDLEAGLATGFKRLCPPWEQLTDEEKRNNGPICEALNQLFFNGGRLENFGLKVKSGVDVKRVYRFIRATLGDYGPSHEHKIGGIAHELKKWVEPIAEVKVSKKKKEKAKRR